MLPDNSVGRCVRDSRQCDIRTRNPLIDLSPCKWTVISGGKVHSIGSNINNETWRGKASRQAFWAPRTWVGMWKQNAELKNLVSLNLQKILFRRHAYTFCLWLLQSWNGYKRKVTLQNQMQTLFSYIHVEWSRMLCVIWEREAATREWSAIKLFSKFIIIKIVHSKLHRAAACKSLQHGTGNAFKSESVWVRGFVPVNNCLLRNNKTYICSAWFIWSSLRILHSLEFFFLYILLLQAHLQAHFEMKSRDGKEKCSFALVSFRNTKSFCCNCAEMHVKCQLEWVDILKTKFHWFDVASGRKREIFVKLIEFEFFVGEISSFKVECQCVLSKRLRERKWNSEILH